MRSIVSLITAFAFLLHLWLGCCAHHGHATEGQTCHLHAAEGASHDHAGHDHGTDSSSEDEPGKSPGPAERCEGSPCVFLKAAQSEVAKRAPTAILPVVASDFAASLSAAPSPSLIDTGGGNELPVRLHLFHQVLLN